MKIKTKEENARKRKTKEYIEERKMRRKKSNNNILNLKIGYDIFV